MSPPSGTHVSTFESQGVSGGRTPVPGWQRCRRVHRPARSHQPGAAESTTPPARQGLGVMRARRLLRDLQAGCSSNDAPPAVEEQWLDIACDWNDVRVRLVRPVGVTGLLPQRWHRLRSLLRWRSALLATDRSTIEFAHQLLLCPVTDAAPDTGSYRQFGEGPFLSATAMASFWEHVDAQRDSSSHCTTETWESHI